jgi:Stress responsive A/B Barrel Domain
LALPRRIMVPDSFPTPHHEAPPMLAHNVYFALHDNSPAAKAKLIAACNRYLTDHPGTLFYACGTLAEDLKRDVNVRDFDVALHVVFTDQAAHDGYQVADRHERFIAENKSNWKSVRVFDSVVEGVG